MCMRKVEVNPKGVGESRYIGILHGFGADYQEYDSECGGTIPGNYAIGIVEKPDGSLRSVPIEFIKFINPTQI